MGNSFSSDATPMGNDDVPKKLTEYELQMLQIEREKLELERKRIGLQETQLEQDRVLSERRIEAEKALTPDYSGELSKPRTFLHMFLSNCFFLAGHPLWSRWLSLHGLSTPYEQWVSLVAVALFLIKGVPACWKFAWATAYTLTPNPDKKFTTSVIAVLNLQVSQLPLNRNPAALARFMGRHAKPAILWGSIPIALYGYILHSLNMQKLIASKKNGEFK